MNIEITTRNGKWTTDTEKIAAAKWERIDSGNDTTWQRDDYSHNIEAIPVGDDTWWDGIEAEVEGADENAELKKVNISLDVADDESSHIFADGEEVVRAETEDGESLWAYDIAELAGYSIGGRMELDYEAAADEFIADHPGARYIMHNHRGFANEWTLWVCDSDEEAEEAIEATNNWDEYTAETVRNWLISAMQTDRDYKLEHGAEKCVCARYWSDGEEW